MDVVNVLNRTIRELRRLLCRRDSAGPIEIIGYAFMAIGKFRFYRVRKLALAIRFIPLDRARRSIGFTPDSTNEAQHARDGVARIAHRRKSCEPVQDGSCDRENRARGRLN